LLIPSVIGGDSFDFPPIGNIRELGNRSYLDGMVNVDSTGSSNGETWFWGYDSPSQVTGDVLNFRATGNRSEYAESRQFSGNLANDERLENLSPQLDFLLLPPSSWQSPLQGFLVSFWFFSDDQSQQFSNFSLGQERQDFRMDFTDRYDVSSIQPLIEAPYQGSFSGPGPLIGNLPFAREEVDSLVNNETATFQNSISTSLDLNGYSLAIGPTFSGEISGGWAWRASAGLTLNLFQWRARESENLNLAINGGDPTIYRSWADDESGTDFRLGVYAKGEIIRELSQDWFAKAYFQAEMADSIELTVGDSQYEFHPRGYGLGIGLGRKF
jgi:hypothetical protein